MITAVSLLAAKMACTVWVTYQGETDTFDFWGQRDAKAFYEEAIYELGDDVEATIRCDMGKDESHKAKIKAAKKARK